MFSVFSSAFKISRLRDFGCQVWLVNKTQFGSQAPINIIDKLVIIIIIVVVIYIIIILAIIINKILICDWFSLLLSNIKKTEEFGTWLSVLLFLPRWPYFKWKVLCFEGVMHYFETQAPPLTPQLQLKKQNTEWTTF